MRNNVKPNKLLDQTFLVCAEIMSRQLIHSGQFALSVSLCEQLPSKVVSDYLIFGLDLVERAYVPDYIELLLRYEYEKLDKATLQPDELKVLIFLSALISRLFQKRDYDFFLQLFSPECSNDTRDQITLIIGEDAFI